MRGGSTSLIGQDMPSGLRQVWKWGGRSPRRGRGQKRTTRYLHHNMHPDRSLHHPNSASYEDYLPFFTDHHQFARSDRPTEDTYTNPLDPACTLHSSGTGTNQGLGFAKRRRGRHSGVLPAYSIQLLRTQRHGFGRGGRRASSPLIAVCIRRSIGL